MISTARHYQLKGLVMLMQMNMSYEKLKSSLYTLLIILIVFLISCNHCTRAPL